MVFQEEVESIIDGSFVSLLVLEKPAEIEKLIVKINVGIRSFLFQLHHLFKFTLGFRVCSNFENLSEEFILEQFIMNET
jgi:hypothetical protein